MYSDSLQRVLTGVSVRCGPYGLPRPLPYALALSRTLLRGPRKFGAATRRERARVEAKAQARRAAAFKLQHAWRTHRVLVARAQRDAEDAEARRRRQEEARARLDVREAEEREKRRDNERKKQEAQAAVRVPARCGSKGGKHKQGRRRGEIGGEAEADAVGQVGEAEADMQIVYEVSEGRIVVKGYMKPLRLSDATWVEASMEEEELKLGLEEGGEVRPESAEWTAVEAGTQTEEALRRQKAALEAELVRERVAREVEVCMLRAELREREQECEEHEEWRSAAEEWRAAADAAVEAMETAAAESMRVAQERKREAEAVLAQRCGALEAEFAQQSEAMSEAWTSEVAALRADMEGRSERIVALAAERDEAARMLAKQRAEMTEALQREAAAEGRRQLQEEAQKEIGRQRDEAVNALEEVRDEQLCVGTTGTGGRQRAKARGG